MPSTLQRIKLKLHLLLSVTAAGLAVIGSKSEAQVIAEDIAGMYEQAKAMLEDRSIQNIEGVPLMLETCSKEQHPEATLMLLDMYEGKFKGLDPNPEKATSLARTLAEDQEMDLRSPAMQQVRTEAMFRLALYLEKGIGVPKNPKEAYKWMLRAAAREMNPAKVELARYLMLGIGTPVIPKEAWSLLRKQARKAPETPHVFFYMGHMCARGIGMPKNSRKAFELFRMGAILNDAQCLNNLGAMFEKGYPTPRDPVIAYRLYRKAANLGNKEASANMQRLAFKEGIRASHISSTPIRKRIDNATLRLIHALPVPPRVRGRLVLMLTRQSPSHES